MGQLYARTLATLGGGAKLYAVAEPDERSRSAIAGEFAVPHACADADELLALDGLDAVVIATPTSTLTPLVVAAAGADKAILCEKPPALTLAETHTTLKPIARSHVPCQIGFMRRFDVAYARARSLIAAGHIGRPVAFKSVGRDPFCPQVANADPAKSGGLIIDRAIHDFDLARWLMGCEVERVTAEGALLVCPELEAVGDFDNAGVNLRFASGALGNVEISRNAFYGYDIRTEVLGSDAALLIGTHHNTPLVLLTREGARMNCHPICWSVSATPTVCNCGTSSNACATGRRRLSAAATPWRRWRSPWPPPARRRPVWPSAWMRCARSRSGGGRARRPNACPAHVQVCPARVALHKVDSDRAGL
jgi:predicted dehydrogenase